MKKNSFYILILLQVLVFNVSYGQPIVPTLPGETNALGEGTYTSSLDPNKAVNVYWGAFKDEGRGLQTFKWDKMSEEYIADNNWFDPEATQFTHRVISAIGAQVIDTEEGFDTYASLQVYLLDVSDPSSPKKGKPVYSLMWDPSYGNGSERIIDCFGHSDNCGFPVDVPVSEGGFFSSISYDHGDKIKSNMLNRGHFLKKEWKGWRKVIVDNQPVVVVLNVGENVEVHEIAIPGIPSYNLAYFFPEELDGKVFVNRREVYDHDESVQAKVGDLLTFYASSQNGEPPSITGLPKTWIARVAQSTQYHVEPSHTPGDFTPWIGMDTRTHWFNVKNFKQQPSRTPNYPDWIPIEGTDMYKLEYVVSNPMTPNYDPMSGDYYHWDKYRNQNGATRIEAPDGKGDAWQKRADQMEGLVVQAMHYWNNDNQPWQDYDGDYKDYSGAQYMMQFDWDEILMVGERHHDGTAGQRALLEDPLRWQIVPKNEGDRITFVEDLVNAFRQFQGGEDYEGYEIQDFGTDSDSPYGAGGPAGTDGWIPTPGNVTISTEDYNRSYNIIAEAPVSKFFSIDGTMWPGNYETTIYKWEGMSAKEIYDTYIAPGIFEITVEHVTEDRYSTSVDVPCELGKLWKSDDGKWATECSYQRYSTNHANDLNIQGSNPFPNPDDPNAWNSNDHLEFVFNTTFSYHTSITVYVKNKLTNEKVALSGKMARTRGLGFLEDSNLTKDHDIGIGLYFFINTSRKVATNDYPYNEDYITNGRLKSSATNPFEREYRFTRDETSDWWTTDYDVHSFGRDRDNPKTEWHQPNYIIANWLYDQDLDAEEMVKYYFEKIEDHDTNSNGYLEYDEMDLGNPICKTIHCEINYANYSPGEYQLTATYRGAERSSARVKVVIVESESQMASVELSNLSIYDFNLVNRLIEDINLKLDPDVEYLVLEAEISSKFMYRLGGRNNYGGDFHGSTDYNPDPVTHIKFKEKNRWSPYHDFKADLKWDMDLAVDPDWLSFDDTTDWKFSVFGQLDGQDQSDADYTGQQVTEMFPVWGNHFSSNWMSGGPSGLPGPDYQTTTGFTSDLNDFADEIRPYFEDVYQYYPGYYQLNVPLSSYSDSYGYFFKNINTSHLLDLYKIFDVETGVFTGNGISSQNFDGPDYVHQPRPSDNFMNLQVWYYDLITGRKVIVRAEDFDENSVRLASDMKDELYRYAEPQEYLDENSLREADWKTEPYTLVELCSPCEVENKASGGASVARIGEKKDVDESLDLDSGFSFYPNPTADGSFTLVVTTASASFLKVSIIDALGRRLFSYDGNVKSGTSKVFFEDVNLPTGIYFLKAETSERIFSKQIVFTNKKNKP